MKVNVKFDNGLVKVRDIPQGECFHYGGLLFMRIFDATSVNSGLVPIVNLKSGAVNHWVKELMVCPLPDIEVVNTSGS
jgi:hypothetical protein